MTKTYTFKSTKNNNKFFTNNGSTNYSKILDDIITADIIKKNDYLFSNTSHIEIDNKPIILNGSYLKADDEFIKAANFLANYKKYTYKIPYTLGKMYETSDGTPIIFYDDEIQIGFDTYKYSSFSDLSFLNSLTAPKKKLIINIFANGISNIKINIL